MNALGTRLVGVRVLVVVDDDEDMRYVVRATLQSHGAIVSESPSAREALDVLRHERPDVLVSDLSMPPGEDGYWLIAAVRACRPRTVAARLPQRGPVRSRPRIAPASCARGSSTTSPSRSIRNAWSASSRSWR